MLRSNKGTSIPYREPTGIGLRASFILVVGAVCGAVWLSALLDTVYHRASVLDMAERQHDNVAHALAEQAARSLQAINPILKQAQIVDPHGAPSGAHQR